MVIWLSDTRYCTAHLQQDLLGDMVLHTTHGGRHNRIGGQRTYVVADQAAGERKIQELHKVRCRHGYEVVFNRSGIDLLEVTNVR